MYRGRFENEVQQGVLHYLTDRGHFAGLQDRTQVLDSQSLKIESAGNVTMKARNRRGFVTNTLSIGEAGLQAVGNYFLIRGTTGNVLLQVDPHEMVVSANHMVVSGK
ncbi:uncharacterized protein TNCV_3053381 [Trichonephila clavipes]|uniref:Uncharacterized protein n=1 Tax=Trichonephila clavipes TaxID=2585209 RepID=A0A8X6RYE7_TRICX|nr:uncharacterized protein TNCV_3053381 [Trichonephila clavipes]